MNQDKLKVFTLGNFSVIRGEKVISEMNSGASKLWELFQYLISRENVITEPEQIIEDLHFDLELIDARNTLENRIYRLRKLLATEEDYRPGKYIKYSQGGYKLQSDSHLWCDIQFFSELYQIGREHYQNGDLAQAREKCLQAVKLYQGDFLQQVKKAPWAIYPRTKYKQKYLELLLITCEILKENQAYSEIENICHQAIKIEPFEEKLHLQLMEAMLKQNEKIKAKQHYQFVHNLFANQEVEPSARLKNLVSDLNIKEDGIYNLEQIKAELEIYDTVNELKLVTPEIFRNYVHHQQQKRDRLSGPLYLASVALIFRHRNYPEDSKSAVLQQLKEVISNSLRKSDIVCQWTRWQFLLLFPDIDRDKLISILERIKTNFYTDKSFIPNELILNTDFQEIQNFTV